MRLLLPVVLLFALGTDSNAAVDLNVTDLQLSVAGENLRIGVYSGPEVSSDQPPFTFSATVELKRGSSTIQVITLGELFGESTVNCESCMGSCSGGCSIRVIEKDFPGGCVNQAACPRNKQLFRCTCKPNSVHDILVYYLKYCGQHPNHPDCSTADARSGDTLTVTLTPASGLVDPDLLNNSLSVTVP